MTEIESPTAVVTDRQPRTVAPPWIRRAVLVLMVGFASLFTVGWLLLRLRGLLLTLIVAQFVALAMEPAVNKLARRGLRRGVATAAVFLGVAVAILLFVGAVGGLVVDQVIALAAAVPRYLTELGQAVDQQVDLSLSGLGEQLRANEGVRDFFTGVAGGALGLSATLLGLVGQAFTVGLFAFYMAAEGPRLRRNICSLLRPSRQQKVLRAWNLAVEKTAGWLYSRGLLAIVAGIAHWAFLAAIGVPYPIALGLWVGVASQFVPTIGIYIAGVLPVLVALTIDPLDALWFVVFMTVYQQFENTLLAPRLTGRTLALHPAIAFGSVMVGAAILGPLGAVLALPVAASVQAFVSSYLHHYDLIEDPLLE